jgi:D-alanyl-D-alanine carboxypeptidase
VGDYFEGVGECKWITDNCHKYGFILRYSEEKETFTKIGPESWHFRYIGVPHSYIVVEKGFCYEEYIDYLKEFPFLEDHLFTTVDGVEYEIYYVEGLEVPVPEEGEYTVSGNNLDGFIVTVTKTASVGEPPQVPAA